MSQHIDAERSHEDAWYRRVVDEGFFERPGLPATAAGQPCGAATQGAPAAGDARAVDWLRHPVSTRWPSPGTVGEVVGLDLSPVAVDAAICPCTCCRRGQRDVHGGGHRRRRRSRHRSPSMSSSRSACCTTWETRAAGRRWTGCDGNWSPAAGSTCVTPMLVACSGRLAGARARRDEFHSPNEQAIDPQALLDDVRAAGFTAAGSRLHGRVARTAALGAGWRTPCALAGRGAVRPCLGGDAVARGRWRRSSRSSPAPDVA